MARDNSSIVKWAEERWLQSRTALISDRLKASKGTGWPKGDRQVPLTPLTIEAAHALTLKFRDTINMVSLNFQILCTIRDGSEIVARYVMRHENADSDRVVVESLESAGTVEENETKVREEYDLAWFDLLREAENRYLDTGNGLAYLLDFAFACLKAAGEGWIKIEPAPQWLEDLEGLYARIKDLDLERVRSWFNILGRHENGVPKSSIAWEAGYMRFTLGGSIAGARHASPLQLTSRNTTTPDIVVHAPLPWVKDIISHIRSSPNTAAGREELLAYLLGRVKEYGRTWRVEPNPFILHPWIRSIVRALQLRYDLEQLDNVNIARISTQGLSLAQGWSSRYVLLLVDGAGVADAIMVELLQGGIERVVSLDTSEFSDLPLPAEKRPEWLSEIQFRLWDKVGWCNFVFAVDVRMLREIWSLTGAYLSPSPFGLLRAIIPFLRLRELSRAGGAAVWPAEMLRDLDRWLKREGVLSVLYSISQAPFRRRHPKSRGPLYVRATIIAAIALIAFIVLVIKLL